MAIRKELKNITVEVKRTKEKVESLWILINNNKIKLRVGVLYLPQEQDQDLKEIYKVIKEQVQESVVGRARVSDDSNRFLMMEGVCEDTQE